MSLVSQARRDPWLAVAWLLALLLLVLVLVPQLWILRASLLAPDGQRATLENFARFFLGLRYRDALLNSLALGIATTLLALLLAVPLAFLHARYELPGRRTVLTLASLATASPPFLGAYAWLMLLGWSGALSRALRALGVPFESLVGFHGIVWVGLWSAVGLVFLLAHDAFSSVDPTLEEAALSSGASRVRAHVGIALPLALPALLTAAFLVFVGVLADFGTPRIVGGPVSVLPTLLYHEFLAEVSANPSMASAGSVVLVGLSSTLLGLQRLALAGRSYALAASRPALRLALPKRVRLAFTALTAVFFLIVFVPHLVLVAVSFFTWRADIPSLPLTLANYRALLQGSLAPVLVSYALAAVSTLLAVTLGTLLAYVSVRRAYRGLASALGALAMLPYVIPGTVLAIGLIVVWNRPPLRLTGTATILVLAYLIRKLPYALKAAEAALHQVHPSLEEAALGVGATPTRALCDVTARLILPSLVSAGAVTFLMALTELSATVMLYGATTTTMSVVIYQAAMGMGGRFGLAASTAVVMLASLAIPLALLRRLVPAPAGGA